MLNQAFAFVIVILLLATPINLAAQSVPKGIPSSAQAELTAGRLVTTDLDDAVIWVDDASIPADGFILDVGREFIRVHSYSPGGRLYAQQMLRKMAQKDSNGRYVVPCGRYSEIPRATWRGLMLDSGRQFQSVATIKRILDVLFELRMNIFHWHMTEGLGWRLEIKKHPNLTAHGSRVGQGPEQQGFYTQEEVRDVIAYAAERNITVVPEIDTPGHAEAALSSYPELGCFGDVPAIPETGFTDNIFCAGKDSTLQFLYDVLDEVCALFPSPYIHLGGDEAPKGNWNRCPDCRRRMTSEGLADAHELQLWFSAQMAQHLKTMGRRAIFWEDVVAQGDYPLPDNVVIQWWNYRSRKNTGLRRALAKGYPVVCSPNYYTYLNFPIEPWRGYDTNRTFTLSDAYERNPLDLALSEGQPLILGGECALWTDYILTEDLLDERLFPRIYAIAQLLWAGQTLPFDDFRKTIGE